jgi:phage terminase small subunit
MAESKLTEKQKLFCSEYIFDWNGSRAYKVAYGIKSDDTAKANAHRLLTNAYINDYIEAIQKDLEKEAGISRMRVIKEWEKIAFASIAHLHNTWVELKEFEKLTPQQKEVIESIETKTQKRTAFQDNEPFEVQVEYVKIKLYSKEKALENIAKMLGYNAPDKMDVTSGGEKIIMPVIKIERK